MSQGLRACDAERLFRDADAVGRVLSKQGQDPIQWDDMPTIEDLSGKDPRLVVLNLMALPHRRVERGGQYYA